MNANVAPATHGEAVAEPLGSGDTTQANQAFRLAKSPLTFVSAATETGSATTLSVRVDDILWTEVPALYDAGPRDEVYQVRIDDGGATRVVFGDGGHGKRLPTGSVNVKAAYRSGMGRDGEVDQETLTLGPRRRRRSGRHAGGDRCAGGRSRHRPRHLSSAARSAVPWRRTMRSLSASW